MMSSATLTHLPIEVVSITEELFPAPLCLDSDVDPELPAERFLVLSVHATGDPKDIVRRRREWHRRVSKFLPPLSIRLSITSL